MRRTIIVYVSSFMQSAKNHRGFTRCQTPALISAGSKVKTKPLSLRAYSLRKEPDKSMG